jgi:hypothetical protein
MAAQKRVDSHVTVVYSWKVPLKTAEAAGEAQGGKSNEAPSDSVL